MLAATRVGEGSQGGVQLTRSLTRIAPVAVTIAVAVSVASGFPVSVALPVTIAVEVTIFFFVNIVLGFHVDVHGELRGCMLLDVAASCGKGKRKI